MISFVRGMTVPFRLRSRYNAVLKNADSATIRVIGPRGTKRVDDVAMTRTGIGTYEYYYTTLATASIGIYHAVCWVTVGTRNYEQRISFRLEEY